MSRKRLEVNPIRGERLKMLLIENGVDQKEFAEKIGYTKEHISYIVNGRRNLTEDAAQATIKQFPGTRIEWLMGYDDFKTEAASFHSVINTMKNESNLLYTGLCALGLLTGYEIIPPNLQNAGSLDNFFKQMKAGYRIKNGNQAVDLSLDEMNRFENEICDFVELKLKHLFKQKGVDSDG